MRRRQARVRWFLARTQAIRLPLRVKGNHVRVWGYHQQNYPQNAGRFENAMHLRCISFIERFLSRSTQNNVTGPSPGSRLRDSSRAPEIKALGSALRVLPLCNKLQQSWRLLSRQATSGCHLRLRRPDRTVGKSLSARPWCTSERPARFAPCPSFDFRPPSQSCNGLMSSNSNFCKDSPSVK